MTLTQIETYLHHLVAARHFRGHGIHSPYLYSYVREVAIRKGDIIAMTEKRYPGKKIEVVEGVKEALASDAYITILPHPFRSRGERRIWNEQRPSKEILTVHFPRHMIIFRDDRLHNQHFMIRR